ncbi:hypothetical protein Vadar_012860 [Vaccinium darrowii]|uniref:Uncharacterized protein n=1 Tax=Vaccinium darrowii TaxID=229202 RepID=A0ACB7YMI6_9ERIC|nr:hypothetical protein Vadar_012860 [Vaccinium darrowii]
MGTVGEGLGTGEGEGQAVGVDEETNTFTWSNSSWKTLLVSPPSTELIVEERNLLSVAYKNVISSLHAAWLIISSIEQKEESRKNEEDVVLVQDYRSKVESELSLICAGILKLLDSNCVPSVSSSESKVFYLKMKGDYHRYIDEFKVEEERKEAVEDTI